MVIITPLSIIFQLYSGGQFLLLEKTGVPGKNHRSIASRGVSNELDIVTQVRLSWLILQSCNRYTIVDKNDRNKYELN